MKNSTRAGVYATVVWLSVAITYALCKWDAPPEPNSLGDFLAGVFSPVAFLWLVLGYRQQGEELQLNTQVLRLQVRELEASVAAQRDLAEATRAESALADKRHVEELVRIARGHQPRLLFVSESIQESAPPMSNNAVVTMLIQNVGLPASNIRLSVEPQALQVNASWWSQIATNGTLRTQVVMQPGQAIDHKFTVTITYRDADHVERTATGYWDIKRSTEGLSLTLVDPLPDF